MASLIILGLLSLFQVINGIPNFSDLMQMGIEGRYSLLDMLPAVSRMLHHRDEGKVAHFPETAFKGNLSSCVQFFYDVQEVPRAFAGLSDALYNATTTGTPLVKEIITCTRKANFMDTLSCLQELESAIRDFYISLHPLFIPAYAAFKDQIIKVKEELDSCLLKTKDSSSAQYS